MEWSEVRPTMSWTAQEEVEGDKPTHQCMPYTQGIQNTTEIPYNFIRLFVCALGIPVLVVYWLRQSTKQPKRVNLSCQLVCGEKGSSPQQPKERGEGLKKEG